MTKLTLNQKNDINGGVTLFAVCVCVFGIANLIGTIVAGAKNIKAASIEAPIEEKIYTNTIYTNNYQSTIY